LLLISLLLLSGDVEINPGPGGTSNIANENILPYLFYDKTTQLQFYVLQYHYPLSKINNIT
jgi:hypothetical protein